MDKEAGSFATTAKENCSLSASETLMKTSTVFQDGRFGGGSQPFVGVNTTRRETSVLGE